MRFFTTVFREALEADAAVLDGADLRLVLFRTSPSGEDVLDYAPYASVDELLALPGWQPVSDDGYPFTAALDVSTVSTLVGATFYIFFSSFRLSELTSKVEVSAVGFQYVGDLGGVTNPLLMVTDQSFDGYRRVLDSDDEITAYSDPDLSGQRWLMSWLDNPDGALRAGSLTFGDIAVALGPPDFQTAHHLDAWLYPQRVNYIANPSFEAIENIYWGTSGDPVARVESPFGGFCGSFTGADVAVESNDFPTPHDDVWTVQLLARGTGTLYVGFVYWDETYAQTFVDWGTDTWELQPDVFLHVKTLRHLSESVAGCLRLQVVGGGSLDIDKVLVEEGALLDWPYFDGDEQYCARDDYSWYGTQGESYSLWYNNKNSIVSRLFTKPGYAEGNIFTEKDSVGDGLVYDWVPAGTVVDHHMDVLYPHDQREAPQPKSTVYPDVPLPPPPAP